MEINSRTSTCSISVISDEGKPIFFTLVWFLALRYLQRRLMFNDWSRMQFLHGISPMERSFSV